MRAVILALAWLFAAADETVTFRIEGMSCEPCASAIEIQLGETPGVTGYTVSFDEAEAKVSYDPQRTTPQEIARSIGVTGFRAFLKAGRPKATDPELAQLARDRPAATEPHDPACDKECCRSRLALDPKTAAELTGLADSLAPLVADFNAARGTPRFVAILSPSCSLCIHGAEALREALLHDASAPTLQLFVVWAPMLTGDDEQAARASSALVKHARVRQYWDPGRRAGTAFRKQVFPDAVAQMRASLPEAHPLRKPFATRDPAQAEWDIYLFFGADAEWTTRAPKPARFVRQVTKTGPRSVLWKNDYAQPPIEATLADALRAEARALSSK